MGVPTDARTRSNRATVRPFPRLVRGASAPQVVRYRRPRRVCPPWTAIHAWSRSPWGDRFALPALALWHRVRWLWFHVANMLGDGYGW